MILYQHPLAHPGVLGELRILSRNQLFRVMSCFMLRPVTRGVKTKFVEWNMIEGDL
jgi:hypothetical protein